MAKAFSVNDAIKQVVHNGMMSAYLNSATFSEENTAIMHRLIGLDYSQASMLLSALVRNNNFKEVGGLKVSDISELVKEYTMIRNFWFSSGVKVLKNLSKSLFRTGGSTILYEVHGKNPLSEESIDPNIVDYQTEIEPLLSIFPEEAIGQLHAPITEEGLETIASSSILRIKSTYTGSNIKFIDSRAKTNGKLIEKVLRYKYGLGLKAQKNDPKNVLYDIIGHLIVVDDDDTIELVKSILVEDFSLRVFCDGKLYLPYSNTVDDNANVHMIYPLKLKKDDEQPNIWTHIEPEGDRGSRLDKTYMSGGGLIPVFNNTPTTIKNKSGFIVQEVQIQTLDDYIKGKKDHDNYHERQYQSLSVKEKRIIDSHRNALDHLFFYATALNLSPEIIAKIPQYQRRMEEINAFYS